MQEMVNINLILAANVKYHFKFRINTHNFSPEPNFSQICPEIKILKFQRILYPETKDDAITWQ